MVRPPSKEEISELTKGPWSKEEDEKLKNYICKNGHEKWSALPKRAGLNRCGKSCRLRWKNYLRPDIKRGVFSDEEQQLIIKLHSQFPKKWSTIASHLPGRTDNDIKNYWNSRMRKKIIQKNVDPIIHSSLLNPTLIPNLLNLMMAYPNLNNAFYPSTNLQLLQNLMQMLNKNDFEPTNFPLRNTFEYSQLSQNLMQNINPNTFADVIISSQGVGYPQQVPFDYNNLGINHQIFNSLPSVSNSMISSKCEFQSKLDNLSFETSIVNLESDEASDIVNQVNSNLFSRHSPCPIVFEDWANFCDDEADVFQWTENIQ